MIEIKYKGTSFINEDISLTKVRNSDDAVPHIRELIGDLICEKEVFCVVLLDGQSKIIHKEIVSIGTLNQSLVHPREVFRPAVSHNAAGIIIAHNHPSGTLEASIADRQITDRLIEASKIMGISIVDHIIVTEKGHFSFEDTDLI